MAMAEYSDQAPSSSNGDVIEDGARDDTTAPAPQRVSTSPPKPGRVESEVLRRFYSDIQHAITDPIAVASLLHQEDVVGEVLLDEVSPSNKISPVEKTASIMRHVEAAVRVDPKSFSVFLSVLDQFTPSYKVARRMKQAVDLHASAAEKKGTLASSHDSKDEVTVSVVYKEDFDAIEKEFVSLHLRASRIILKKSSVTLQRLKELLSFYPQLEMHIQNAENVTEVMQVVQRHSSFINCSYLKHVAEHFELPEVTKEIGNYNKLVDDFCNNKIIQHSYMRPFTTNPPQYTISSQTIKIKIMLEWNPVTKTLSDIRSLLRKAFKVLSPLIHVDVIGEGSVTVVCYAPHYLMGTLVKMTKKNKSMLLENSVSYLSIGYTVVLDSTAVEKEEAHASDLKQENTSLQLKCTALQDQCKELQSPLSELLGLKEMLPDEPRLTQHNFFILPADPQAWRQVHASCKRENMVICVEATDNSHPGSRSVQPMFVDLARETSNIPFFRIEIGFGRTFDQLRDDLGGITHTPTVIVVFYDDDGMRIRTAQGVEEVHLAMRTGWFKTRIRDFLKQRAKLKLAERLAEELAGHPKNEMEERQKRARLEYEERLRRERERERLEELRRQQEEAEREQEKRERENRERQREAIEIKKREREEELRRSRPQAMDALMKMDLNTARIRDIKEVMSKLGISYVGLYERKEMVDRLKTNVPKLWTKSGSQQSSSPMQSYRSSEYSSSPSSPTATQWQRRAEMSAKNVEELESRRQSLSSEVTSLQRKLKEKDETIQKLQSNRQSSAGSFSNRRGGGEDVEALCKRVKELEDELLETKMLYTTTLEDYELEGSISQKEEGAVVRVRCTRSDLPTPDKVYVMKMLHSIRQNQTATRVTAYFKNEFDILCRLPQHENIIHQYAFFYDRPMKYPEFKELHAEGTALFILLEELHQNMAEYLQTLCGFTSPKAKQAIHWLKCLLSGLQYLFSYNIVHRDLKLDNLLMNGEGLKICDFGMAVELDTTMVMPYMPGTVRGGNPAHLAPEILNARPGARRQLSYVKQPVWAAGVLAYELSGLSSPFESIDQQAYATNSFPPLKATNGAGSRDAFPPAFTRLVQSMLDFKPENRPTLAEALKQVSSL